MLPIFFRTSEGYLNLLQIIQIERRREHLYFTFAGGGESGGEESMCPYSVGIPVEEGLKIVKWLDKKYPDMFTGISKEEQVE